MQRFGRLLITALFIAAGGWVMFKTFLQPSTTENAGMSVSASTAPLWNASFVDGSGKPQDIKQWKGKVLIVNFWATWCPPCRDEMPELSLLNSQYQAKNLQVIGISTDDAAKITEFAASNKMSYPLLAGDMEASNLADGLGNMRGALPFTVLLDRDGAIIKAYVGRLDMKTLENDLQPLL